MPVDAATIADQLMLGRYRLLEERGKGGFGTVSVCWDPRLMRRVAIKTIPLHMAQPVVAAKPARRRNNVPMAGQAGIGQAGYPGAYLPDGPGAGAKDPGTDRDQAEHNMLLRAALAETRTASMLAHPNIVAMLDFENDDENAYIIMEYVEGASLAELLDATEDGLLTADEAAAVVEAVSDALQFAHENGVLHLDIKPDNILIDMSGRVKLADFGMAALSSVTGYAGARGGTVGYMPPEQIRCENVDVRTDVFAFASVMFESLTGVRPFAAAKLSDSLALVERGVADPCALNESVPPAVADALLVALDPDPAVRPVSAEAFGDEMLAGLGRPKAGRKSLAAFVADVLDDSRPADEDDDFAAETYAPAAFISPHDRDLGPVSAAAPRVAPVALRVAGACSAGMTAALAVQSIVAAMPPYAALVAGVAVAALGLAAPYLGYALALVALVIACLAAQLWPLALALALAGGAWWALAARSFPRSSATALAGSLAVGQPPAAPALVCGYLLPAGPAALSALVAFCTCTALVCLSGANEFGAYALARFAELPASAAVRVLQAGASLASLASSPRFWLTGAAWAGAAAALGALCHHGSKTRCYLGCLASCLILVAAEAVAGRMENGGSWAAAAPEVAAYALGSTILVALLVFLFGSPRALDVDGAEPPDDTDDTGTYDSRKGA